MILINLATEAGLEPKWVAGTQGGEYHSACPKCGGKDRFFLQPHRKQKNCIGYYHCRQCETSGDTIQFARDFLGASYEEALQRAGGTKQVKSLLSFVPQNRDFRPIAPKQPESQVWSEKAAAFVGTSHNKLLLQAEVLVTLEQRGIPLEAVKKNKLGWSSLELSQQKADWGLDKEVWLPNGLVIPLRQKECIVGIKVRRYNIPREDSRKYVVISGGTDGFTLFGETKNRDIMAIVESELDAIAMQHAAGDICYTVAIGGNNKNPDSITDFLAKKAKRLLVIPDNDEGGNAMLAKLQKLYPHAQKYATPLGKDIGEAVQQGLNIRAWIIAALPEQLQRDLNLIETSWNQEDQLLIDWILQYISERTTTKSFYTRFEQEINLGAHSPRAKTGELQAGLRLMKQLIEDELKRRS